MQLARPGTPVLYGTATSNAHLRSGAPAIGSPESAFSIGACAQLARHYKLPCRDGAALTHSHLPDAHSNYERMMTLLILALSGADTTRRANALCRERLAGYTRPPLEAQAEARLTTSLSGARRNCWAETSNIIRDRAVTRAVTLTRRMQMYILHGSE